MARSRLATAVPLLALLAGIGLVDCGGDDTNVTGTGGSAGMGGASATGGSAGTGGVHGDGAPQASADASMDSSMGGSSADAGTPDAALDVAAADAAGERASNDAATPDVLPADAVADITSDSAAADVAPESAPGDAAPEAAIDALPLDVSTHPPDAAPDVAPPVVDAAAETSTAETGLDAATTPSEAAVDASSSDASDGGVTFAEVVAFFSAPVDHCTNCHNGSNGTILNFATQPDTALYALLTSPIADGIQDSACGGGGPDGGNQVPIVPGSLEASFLWLKITGTQPAGCGQRMPRGCNATIDAGANRCLGDADTQIIRDWILEGAPGP